MHNARPISTRQLFNAESVIADSVTTSAAIDLREITANGFFSLHHISTGSATFTISYACCSTADGTFVTPEAATDIDTNVAAGTFFATFDPELAPFIKIVFTETATDTGTITAWLNIQ